MNWENLTSPARAALKNTKISFWIGKDLEAKPKTSTQKIPILNLGRSYVFIQALLLQLRRIIYINNAVHISNLT